MCIAVSHYQDSQFGRMLKVAPEQVKATIKLIPRFGKYPKAVPKSFSEFGSL